ncbi:hypothetical protein H6P81_013167 [Aristolochia fimbriata]|uniref:peptidylprolyl isomerase n=1 Tax=Aristolochia fimbriata TaxID=158543 RepID=A0AAV7EFI8_ARIFI|nr:hypothetical protein H6P81_013167 [Aristolochia fimbriata]
MEIAVKTLFVSMNPQLRSKEIPSWSNLACSHRGCLSLKMGREACEISARSNHKLFAESPAVSQVNLGFENDVSPRSAASDNTSDTRELKMRVDVSGAKTQVLFDDIFSKLVAAAQPIPGFRRVKGGKTPDVPKDVLLHVLGPSKVYKKAIQKIINYAVAEIVEEEGLKVTNNLKIEESYEELEAVFEPGKDFSFNAIVELQQTQANRC